MNTLVKGDNVKVAVEMSVPVPENIGTANKRPVGAINVSTTSHAAKALVEDMRRAGLNVPTSITQELELAKQVRQDALTPGKNLADAQQKMASATTTKDFVAAQKNLASVLATNAAMNTPEYRNTTDSSIAQRIAFAVYDASAGIQDELCERFNVIVAELDLNREARWLPDFADPAFNAVSMDANQIKAMGKWKEGAERLSPYWAVYLRLAKQHGISLGSANDPSANQNAVYALGDIKSHGQVFNQPEHVQTVPDSISVVGLTPGARSGTPADAIMAWKMGADGGKRFAPLMPFVALPLYGIDLRLKSLTEMSELRESVQVAGL